MRCLLMMMIFSLFTTNATAQQVPDYESIEKDITDNSSRFYYPSLLERFMKYDTALSAQDYAHLYFGYSFQPGYQTNWISPDNDKLSRYYRAKSLSPTSYDSIISLTRNSIALFPFALREMNFLTYVLHLKGEEAQALQVQRQVQEIIKTIFSTGDGKTCATGYHVLTIDHEYTVMNIFRLSVASQALIGNCDLLKSTDNAQIYFSIGKILAKEAEAFGVEPMKEGKKKKKKD